MSGQTKHCDLTGLTASNESETRRVSKLSQTRSKTNRLSKSLRQTQHSPSLRSTYNCQKGQKTPKRNTRIRLNGQNNADSPNNDSDLQQDIIWDATSPAPLRNGRRTAKSSANLGIVDISEIVNRIAPKNEKPDVSESYLLQWIGDSAVPFTPEVRQPRTRKKSTKQNNVEDLMKLAKQFDINMIQQDKEHAQESHLTAIDGELGSCVNDSLLSLTELTDKNKVESSTSNGAAKEPAGQMSLDREMDDNLDALFDGPTQPVSGRLSQSASVHSQDGNAGVVNSSSKPVGLISEPRTFSTVSSGEVEAVGVSKTTAADNDFDDDWDDDFINDPFVLQMTLNPDTVIAAPKHCSTQMGFDVEKQHPLVAVCTAAHGRAPTSGDSGPKENSKSKSRRTFTLEANSNFRVKALSKGGPENCSSLEREDPEEIMSGTHKPYAKQSVTAASATTPFPTGSRSSVDFRAETDVVDGKQAQIAPDRFKEALISDEDLNLFFASDSLWDDGDDDDLCQVCDDVEKFSQFSPVISTSAPSHPGQSGVKTVPSSDAFEGAAVQGGCGGGSGSLRPPSQNAQLKPLCTFNRSNSVPGTSAAFTRSMYPTAKPLAVVSGSVVQGHGLSTMNAAQIPKATLHNPAGCSKAQCAITHVKNTSACGPMGGSAYRPTPGLQDNQKRKVPLTSSGKTENSLQSSFKRHMSDPVILTNKVFVPSQTTMKCSEAEIERKKQQAMARRRLRMQSSQKCGAPT